MHADFINLQGGPLQGWDRDRVSVSENREARCIFGGLGLGGKPRLNRDLELAPLGVVE